MIIKSQTPSFVKENVKTSRSSHCYHEKNNKTNNLNITLGDIVKLVTVKSVEEKGKDFLVHIEKHDVPVHLTLKELMSPALFQRRIFEATRRAAHIKACQIKWLMALDNALHRRPPCPKT